MAMYKYFSVEVPLLLCMFSFMLQSSIITNLYVYRTCYTILGYSKSDCAQLGNEDNNLTHYLEPKVQPTVNNINMVQSTTMSIVPLLFCMYVGTWSDKFGRKFFLVLCLIGLSLTTSLATVIVSLENMSTWWFTITSIPSMMTGGVTTLFLMVSAYIADVTTPADRAFRFTIIEIIMGVGSFTANLSSSYLFYATSYETVFVISATLTVLSVVYTCFFIPESLTTKEKVPKVTELLQYISFRDIIENTFKKRENNARTYILVLLGLNLVANFAIGEMGVMSLFLRAKFHWTLTKITLTNSIMSVIHIAGTLFGTVLLYKLLKVKELPLAIFSVALSGVACVLRGIAINDVYIYAALDVFVSIYVIGMCRVSGLLLEPYTAFGASGFRGLFMIMSRTILSYMVSPAEMGKLFAVQSILMSVDETIANLVYPSIYTATLNTNSGIFNFLSAGLYAVVGIIFIFMLKTKIPHYEAPPGELQSPELEKTKISININNFEVLGINEKRSSKHIISLEVIDTRTFSLR